MKLVNSSELRKTTATGDRGEVVVTDFLAEKEIVFGLREAGPGSLVPKRPHSHPLRQAMYVIEGSGVVTNGKDELSFKSGDFILFDGDEEHYFDTGKTRLRMVEIRFP